MEKQICNGILYWKCCDVKVELEYQRLDKFSLPENFRGRSPWFVQLWWLVQDTLFRWSPQFMYGWRRLLLRCFGARIGRDVLIRPTARVTYPWKVSVDDHVWIGDDVVLYSLEKIEIGMHAVISQKSYICTGSHDFTKPTFDIYALPIKIGPQVWIAADVFVAPGVQIGAGTVVGARSSVLHDLPAGMVCYGSPAKMIKSR